MHLIFNIIDVELHITGFAVIRRYKIARRQGGVYMNIHEDVIHIKLMLQSKWVRGTSTVQIHKIDVVLCTIYRPPNISHHGGIFEDSLIRIAGLTNLEQHIIILFLSDVNATNVKSPQHHILSSFSLHGQNQSKSLVKSSRIFYME